MPRKIDLITELHRRTVAGLTVDGEHWCKFLQTAAYQYKYPFADQVLIHAQKPGATACAELEVWNRYFDRWINRGAHGIALLREKNGHLFLDHVFDVSDTHNRTGEKLKLWSVRKEYTDELVSMLGNRYGDINRQSLADAVISAAYIAAEDNLPDYKDELFQCVEGSFLDGYDDDNLRFRLQEILQASVAYTVLTRLGYRADDYVDADAFQLVHEFSTPATVSVLGAANGDISEVLLRDIERCAKACEKNLQEQNRTFDGNAEKGYNGGEERNTKENGGLNHDDHIHDEERRTVPESDHAGADRANAGQVRHAAAGLSESPSQGDVFPDAGERYADRTSLGDRADSESTDLGEYIPDGTEPWGNGADETDRPDEMGGDDEQSQTGGGGRGADHPDLSVDRSVDQSNAAISDSALPRIADPESLMQILRHGDYLRCSKEEIVSFLSSDASEADKVEYVRKAYPPLQFSEFVKAGTHQYLGYRADNEGLLLYEGNFPSRTAEMQMDWAFVTSLIGALIKDQNYLDEPITQDQIKGKQEPVSVSEYDLHLGANVYIGKNECEILSLDKDKVELFDDTLFPLEMDYDTFIRRVRENPLNNHLRKGVTEPVTEMPQPVVPVKPKAQHSRKRSSVEPTIESVTADLEGDYARWDELLTNGGSDPTWSDGVNMNLVQGRIVANRRRLLEMCGDSEKPAILNCEEPPRMSDDYMARADEIREAAKKSLEIYQSNPTYRWCREQVKRIPDKMLKNSVISNILGYVTGLESYIEKDDLVSMRRHRDPERYIDSFNRCKQEIENLLPQIEHEQRTDEIFDRLMNHTAFGDERPQYSKSDHTESLSIWQRYEQVKQLYPEAVAAIRVGDFYEFFDQDAERVSEILDLILTSRRIDDGSRAPMCGIPFHATDKYFSKLLDAGIKVAVDDNDLTPRIILPDTVKQEKRYVVVESDAAIGDPYEVWDGEKNEIYIDENGNKSTFISRWQAEDFASELNHWEYEKTRDHSGELFYEDSEPEPASQEYDLGFGHLGNGLTVWNRLQEEHGDYKTIAHIDADRTVKFYDEDIPENVKQQIYEIAAISDDRISATQDIPIFSTQTTVPVYDTHPEIPDSEKHNYRITDDEIGMGGAKEKFRKNIAAINLLHELESDHRLATPEEQEMLAQYSGWGGLADAFDESKDNWSKEFTELYTTLSPEEYRAAEESTLTAFYTPPVVIQAMYKALENIGFRQGNVLEPSCGVGNFMGLVPENMDARMYGVELDSLSGRIARQLYQKNSITISGFEKTQFPDSFFDVAIGNVPFGDFQVVDKRYDKHHFLIHDYFFSKALDKVRPGGVIAFITSSGTLDKQNPSVRKYIAQRADFLGAIRLPNNTFDGAGAEKVVSDIIFLQKRDRMIETEPDWIHLGKDENGISMNQYFLDHPDMVLGDMVMRSGQYGPEPTCKAYENESLDELLAEAITNIHAEIADSEIEELTGEETESSIPADPTVKNFSFTLVDGEVYYRENSSMKPVQTSLTGENRIKGMIAIRDTVRDLINAQLENYPDETIRDLQAKLNLLYDNFTFKYGLINSRANSAVFSDDNSYFLLCSLEILDDNKELKAKADMFTKRTIKPQVHIDRVDTASEALAVSIGERAFVDMEFMSALTGKSEEELFADLNGVVFLNPHFVGENGSEAKYLTADEYLSGNVRQKLKFVREKVESGQTEFEANVKALEQVQPKDLTAAEIGVKLGSTWIPEQDIKDFIFELLGTSGYLRYRMDVKYVEMTAQWVITNKTQDFGNIKANSTYGTKRINAYQIIEETLNLKDVRIMDYYEDENGNKKAVLNKKETMIAQGKQEQIKRAFEEWIWKDPARRERLCRLYNEKFNSIRPREYDGSHIKFVGMNPEITLRQHQKNAVARSLYGGNALYAHVVGAGKTFTMVAAAQEGKRLGLCSKSMFVVPNHLIKQWASEYLQLYPSANILVATKKDFETKNRKKFCARIATGDYDAVIIGHSQFEKIPVSVVRQMRILQDEIDTITDGIEKLKYERGERVTVKQFQKMKKQLETKLEKLNDRSRKDDVVCFEELGVDRLFVDESHFYKNLFAFTKMRNVAGIAQSEAQKSSDLYMKCRYLDELTGGKGITFATGTPISNTMVELYTIQRYLQFDELNARGLSSFDAWASTFGETVTAIELSPDGSGYRTKTRFAKFFNIPELMAMFKQVADVQTADMLNLPVPKANFHVVKTAPGEIQKELVESFAERAEKIHNKMVTAQEDNMLLVTNDGRKAALDQRLIDPMLPDFEGSKVNACVQNIYEIWERNTDKRSAQLVFCDLSTPKNDGTFNVYDDIRTKLVARGIPPEEIAFIHSADTDVKKQELFAKVRAGQVRVLLGSTFKMGAGTNVQQRLIALHDLDVPWRPSDLEQRSGRIIRQGNSNPEVDIYRYVTEGTFDAYCYQLLESKQKFISQIMTSKSPVRVAEDVDETALSYAEIKALASGNPKIMEKMQLDNDVAKLKLQKAEHFSQRYALEDKLTKDFPRVIAKTEEWIAGYKADMQTVTNATLQGESEEKTFTPMIIMGKTYAERAEAGKAILEICKKITNPDARPLGEYRGLKTEIGYETNAREFFIDFKGKMTYRVSLGQDAGGIITRLDNALNGIEKQIGNCEERLAELHRQVENAKAEIAKPFPDEELLESKCKRLDELNSELNMDKRENELADDASEQDGEENERTSPERDER